MKKAADLIRLSALLVWLPVTLVSAADLNQTIEATIAQNQKIANAGYSVAVLHKGQVILSKGYGLRDKERRLPVTTHTRFYIGSNTKSFTVLGLAMLRDEGLLDFEQPVTRYLPDFTTIDSSVTARLTLADMLSHRTGLPRHDAFWSYTNLSRDEIVRRIRFLEMDYRPEFGFRKGFSYNNLMYMAAGTIAEKIKGVSWEEFTRSRILVPLNMTESGFGRTGFIGHADVAAPYDAAGELLAYPLEKGDAVGPAGTIYSTAEDMLKYLDLYLRLGKAPGGQVLISQDRLTDIFKPRNDAKDRNLMSNATLTYYGMGWWVDYDGKNWVGYHGGGLGGYTSQMAFDQANQIAVVVLGNHRGDSAVSPIAAAVVAYLHGVPAPATSPNATMVADLDPADPPTGLPAPLSKRRSSAGAALRTIAAFRHPGYGDMQIVTDGDSCYYTWFDNRWTIIRSDSLYEYCWRGSPHSGYGSAPTYLEKDSAGDTVALYPLLEPYAISRFVRVGSVAASRMPSALPIAGEHDLRVQVRQGIDAVMVTVRSPGSAWVIEAFDLSGAMIRRYRGGPTSGTTLRWECGAGAWAALRSGAIVFRLTDATGLCAVGRFPTGR